MGDSEQKALELMAQAEKKLKSSGGFFGSLMGSGSKTEDAIELYVKAGNSFKMAKKWSEAGDAYCRAADINIKGGNRHEAATQFIDAANCFKKTNINEAVNCMQKGIEIFTDMGRFTIAAKHHIDIAEIYEADPACLDKAISNYQQAADYYQGEESNSSANKCLLKVAQYSGQTEQYEKASLIYEQAVVRSMSEACCHPLAELVFLPGRHRLDRRMIGRSSMDSALLRHGAKDHFFRAGLCRMCQDLQDGANALAKYTEMCPTFGDSRECKLLQAVLTACEENNVDGFSDAVRDFDAVSRLDAWHTSLLLRIKKGIESDSDLR